MEKAIYRRITQYVHTFVKLNKDFTISDKKEFVLGEKLGVRSVNNFKKENGIEGYSLVDVEEKRCMYAMTVNDFIKNGKLVKEIINNG